MTKPFPGIMCSRRVPTEYDVTKTATGFVFSDDRGREFTGFTLGSAFRKAERAQDPHDPIHHAPFPDPAKRPLPKKGKYPALPDGWLYFGHHKGTQSHVRLEYSEAADDSGRPLWERPYNP